MVLLPQSPTGYNYTHASPRPAQRSHRTITAARKKEQQGFHRWLPLADKDEKQTKSRVLSQSGYIPICYVSYLRLGLPSLDTQRFAWSGCWKVNEKAQGSAETSIGTKNRSCLSSAFTTERQNLSTRGWQNRQEKWNDLLSGTGLVTFLLALEDTLAMNIQDVPGNCEHSSLKT